MQKKKALLIVCDGVGDRPINGRTPLQMAKKPAIDALARKGASGLMDVMGPGIVPDSDTAHLSLFGYGLKKYYTGRGPFEALGMGIKLGKGDIAFRCNFATVDDKLNVTDRRAGRIESTKELEGAINSIKIPGVKITFLSGKEHRGVLVLRGAGLSHKISNSDPHKLGAVLKAMPLDKSKKAKRTASILNEFLAKAHKLLKSHPFNIKRERAGLPAANALLTRGAGIYKKADSLFDRYGFRSACIAGGALYKGVAKFVGMDVLNVKGATGGLDTDVMAKARAAKEALKKYEFVFVHIKGTDTASHDGKLGKKVEMIEKIDALAGFLTSSADCIIITADHSTPVSLREHSADPVPLLICGQGVQPDGNKTFDELSAQKGGLGRIRGLELMPIITSLMGCKKPRTY